MTSQLHPDSWGWVVNLMKEVRPGHMVIRRARFMYKVYLTASHLYVCHLLVSFPFSSLPSQPTPTQIHTHSYFICTLPNLFTRLIFNHYSRLLPCPLYRKAFLFSPSIAPCQPPLSPRQSSSTGNRPSSLKAHPFLTIRLWIVEMMWWCVRKIPKQNWMPASATAFFSLSPHESKRLGERRF